ncbi:carboxymuconolactone decarboxylase family protein [Streptomyces sp. NPDC032161]|uniref:carboxymuconolactone decarboxylase family protein n=1 Tax=unclassified Streptomyces TaxID=2593676 RepID=UPI0033DEB8AF
MPLEESTQPKSLREVVELRVGQINGCGFCVDIHTKEAAAGETALRLNLVAVWRHSTVFTDVERAALALAEEGTRLGDHGVSDETWAEVRKHFDDDRVGALVCLVALINAATRMNVIVDLGPERRPWAEAMESAHGLGQRARNRDRNRARIQR